MNDIEHLVREALDSSAASSPRPGRADPAGSAIRRAQRLRRGRAAVAAVGAAVAVALVLGVGAAALRPDASPPPPAGPAPFDSPDAVPEYVVDGMLHSGSGVIRLPVAAGDTAGAAYRVDDGWLYTTERKGLRYLSVDGTAVVLLARSDEVAVSADAGRVAWVDGRRMFVAVRDGRRLVARRSTPLPATERGIYPVTWAGGRLVLMLDGSCCGGDGGGPYVPPRFDTWDPDRGDYVPTWNPDVLAVWGPTADGSALVGAVDAKDPRDPMGRCLARLDPAERLRVTARACVNGHFQDDRTALSPDGRWMLSMSAGPALFDLGTVFTRPRPTALFPPTAAEPEDASWIDSRHVGVLLPGRVAVWSIDDPGRWEDVPLPPGATLVEPRTG